MANPSVSLTNYYGIQYALSNVAAGTTDAVLVAGVAGYLINVKALVVSGPTNTQFTLNDKTVSVSTPITCLFSNGAEAGFVLPFCGPGWCQTLNAGSGLTVTTTAGGTLGFQILYTLVPAAGGR